MKYKIGLEKNLHHLKYIPLSIIDKALKINPIVGSFMYSLYYDGNITWSKPEFKEFLMILIQN